MTAIRVCIIGGGMSSIGVITELQKRLKDDVDITLVTPALTKHFYIASVRAIVEPEMANQLFVPYKKLFDGTNGRVIQSEAIKIEESRVFLKNGEIVKFDYLVACTGMQYSAPFKTSKSNAEESIQQFKDISADILKSKTILLVGGGPTGVEVAGEIADKYPEKKITLIHGGSQLIPGGFKDSFKQKVKSELEKKNVKVIVGEKLAELGTYIPNSTEKGWATGAFKAKSTKGTDLEFDLVINCSGSGKPNSDYLADFDERVLDAHGFVKVRPTLQFEEFDNLFACGDVSNFDRKVAAATNGQSVAVAKNIVALSKGKKLVNASKFPTLIAVSIGKTGGVSQIFWVWGNTVTRMLKSKTLMVPMAWKSHGLPVPEMQK